MEEAHVYLFKNRKFSDFYLCFCGYAKCEPLHSFGPAVRPNYLMHIITEGRGKYSVDGKQYELKAGQGFLIEPEVQTFYQADNVLLNAPHPEYEAVADVWDHTYTRQKAVYPTQAVRDNKFWINVARVDNTLGDRKLLTTRYETFE